MIQTPSEVPGWPHEPVPTCILEKMERERGKDVGIVFLVIYLGGGLKYVLFSSLFGEMIQFDYFSDELKPPARYSVMGGNDGEFERENCGAKMSMILGRTLTLNVDCLFGSFIHTKEQVGELLLKYLLRRLDMLYILRTSYPVHGVSFLLGESNPISSM